MVERVCVNVKDNMEELRTSLKEARSQAVEFEAQIESLIIELSEQSALSTHLRSKLLETQEQLPAIKAALTNLQNRNAAMEEQVGTQEKRISSLDAVNGWLRLSEHPGDIHHKFDFNANPYKLLELQEQKRADYGDFIDDMSVEIANLKKDRARFREQVDQLESISKRFAKEAADKNHQLQRYQEFFQNLFEPKRASEFVEMVARKLKRPAACTRRKVVLKPFQLT
ncbi:unnamed protein product [Schistocephalus solidus]|uniref:Uncharacterized protein n=1 Tax=Schistocephalus solidus TaxID=70667 RepID=A0A183S9P9_SCHSO|nr:unnamed protein product [Schistocephalus solidus]